MPVMTRCTCGPTRWARLTTPTFSTGRPLRSASWSRPTLTWGHCSHSGTRGTVRHPVPSGRATASDCSGEAAAGEPAKHRNSSGARCRRRVGRCSRQSSHVADRQLSGGEDACRGRKRQRDSVTGQASSGLGRAARNGGRATRKRARRSNWRNAYATRESARRYPSGPRSAHREHAAGDCASRRRGSTPSFETLRRVATALGLELVVELRRRSAAA